MAPTVIQGIWQSMEMIYSNQNIRLSPGCLHNPWEPYHHNASPPLTLRSPCPLLLQSLSPYPVLAKLSLTRPLSLNSLMITQDRSAHTPLPITHLHLSPQAWGSRWRRWERARVRLWRDTSHLKPQPHPQPNDTPSHWRTPLPRAPKELALCEGRKQRTGSVPAFPLALHQLWLQGLSAVWAGDPSSLRNLPLNSLDKQSSPPLPAGRKLHLAPLQLKRRQWQHPRLFLLHLTLPTSHRLPLLSTSLFPSRPWWCRCRLRVLK